MSENIQKTPEAPKPSTEIDLGELFRMIGNAFNRFIAFLRNILLFLFDLIIRTLIIIKVHFVKFVIVAILSIVVGLFIDSRQPPIYSSTMTVQTNYGSTRQLYTNVRYYNNLVEERDSATLSKIFGIDKNEANHIIGFYIEPSVTENEIIRAYDKFMKAADTSLLRDNIVTYLKFRNSIDPLEYNKHKIGISSLQKGIFSKLQEDLINHEIENEYIARTKDVRLRNLEEEQKELQKRLVKIDTLRSVYNQSILSESKKTSSAQTNIQMSSSSIKTNEIELFALDDKIAKEILKIKEEKELGKRVIEVLNNFSPGSESKSFFNSFLFRIPILTLSFLLLFILLRELNSYLNTYQENKKLNV